jgi:hypothetical protein
VLVCSGCAIERHDVPVEAANLPRGWAADRSAVGGPWIDPKIAAGCLVRVLSLESCSAELLEGYQAGLLSLVG